MSSNTAIKKCVLYNKPNKQLSVDENLCLVSCSYILKLRICFSLLKRQSRRNSVSPITQNQPGFSMPTVCCTLASTLGVFKQYPEESRVDYKIYINRIDIQYTRFLFLCGCWIFLPSSSYNKLHVFLYYEIEVNNAYFRVITTSVIRIPSFSSPIY